MFFFFWQDQKRNERVCNWKVKRERGFTSDKEDNEAKVDCSTPGCMNVPFCDITADCEAFSVAQFFNIFGKNVVFNRFPKEEANKLPNLCRMQTMKHFSRSIVSLHEGHLDFSFGWSRTLWPLKYCKEAFGIEKRKKRERRRTTNKKHQGIFFWKPKKYWCWTCFMVKTESFGKEEKEKEEKEKK